MLDEISSGLKKLLPSIALFVVGYIIGYNVFDKTVSTGIFWGWAIGGYIWGWFLVRKWFPPREGSGSDTSLLGTMMLCFRLFASVFVGLIAMPLGLVQFIITIIKASTRKNPTTTDYGEKR